MALYKKNRLIYEQSPNRKGKRNEFKYSIFLFLLKVQIYKSTKTYHKTYLHAENVISMSIK